VIRLRFDIPESAGSYQGTRFDWSGIIRSLRYRDREIYGQWFDRIEPDIHDNVRRARADGTGEVVTGIASSGQGPAQEFLTGNEALGFGAAPAGGLFLKIGVGILRRPDAQRYDRYRAYEIVDGGRWETEADRDSVTFRQTLANSDTGYGYVYSKTLRLMPGEPVLRITHSLRNTGKQPLVTSVYNHNFFAPGTRVDGDFRITTPWALTNASVPQPELTRIAGNRIEVLKPLATDDMIALPVTGFGEDAGDYAFRVEDAESGTGYSVQGDRPLEQIWLWSIWTNVSMESFIGLRADPGEEERWSYTYTYSAP
jgi:hypothetical protein